MCKISVIIPYYNSEDTIIRALKSVINQTYNNFEVILVDDGSTDKSYQRVNDFIQEFGENISIKNINQTNMGPSCARNNGIKEASGEYIAFLDSDDEWMKDKLEIQANILEKNNIDLLGSNIYVANGEKKLKIHYTKKEMERITFKKMLFKNYFATSTVVVRKIVIENEGMFPINQKNAEDNYVFTKIVRKYNGYVTNDFLATYFKSLFGESGLSANIDTAEKWELTNFYRFRKENDLYEKKLSLILYMTVNIFSILKYMRRKIIVLSRKIKIKG